MMSTSLALIASLLLSPTSRDDPWIVYAGGEGPGAGKHIVLVAGDEEYRSEEALPMLARILAEHHGFRCTVLFSTNPADGSIDPTNQTNIPGMEKLAGADMLVLFTRFRELPDEEMKHFVDYVEAGKPILGIRTATHAFDYKRDKESPYARYSWRNAEWEGGFGKQVLGETWVNHHGKHGSQSTRGVLDEENAEHPILRGVADIWGPTDVYGIRELPANAQVLVWGQVLEGMEPDDAPVVGPVNDPMMPIIWVREHTTDAGVKARIACSTIGASVDLQSADLRRVFVNTCYWGIGLDVPAESEVAYVGDYAPTFYGFGKEQKGVMAADHRLK